MRDEEEELWKPVKGYEKFYEVSNLGRIRTIERYINLPTHSYLKKQKLLTQFKDGRGYKHVKLYDGFGHPKSLVIHRIVLPSFSKNENNLPEINHIDGNKLNNRLDNLEWCTRGDNIRHSYSIRDVSTYSGESSKSSKLTEEQVLSIREEYKRGQTSYPKLSRKYNTVIGNIGSIISRDTWKHI